MNLTDGSILCGRKNFDGSGGNNHAVERYAHSGFPLAVKLGTITGMVVRVVEFSDGGTKLERFLPKNQHTQRKLLNFENWVSGEVSRIGHHFSK